MSTLSKENIDDITKNDSKEILKKLRDKSMSIAIIDKNGESLVKVTNTDNVVEEDDNDGDDDSKEIDEKKIKEISVPILSKEQYINICNEEGNLEATYEIVEDKNSNCQLVGWSKSR